jgi:hypothetical protein
LITRKLFLLPGSFKNPWSNRITMDFDIDFKTKYDKKGRRPVILLIGNENELMENFEKRINLGI